MYSSRASKRGGVLKPVPEMKKYLAPLSENEMMMFKRVQEFIDQK